MCSMWREFVNLFKDDDSIFVPEKPQSSLRWIILVLACLMLVGSYYCFDIPAALKTQIDDYFGDPSYYETYFSLFYTLYAAPNVILPFFGGYFVDKFGVRLCLLVFASLIAVGQVIFSLGLSVKSWPIMFLGRLVFGFGGESLVVANSALLADWFKGKELAFAFGINLSIARLGSVFNNLLSPALTSSAGLIFAMWFGAMICAASVFCVVLTMPIDKAMDMKLAKKELLLPQNEKQEAMEYSQGQDETRKLLETPGFSHDQSFYNVPPTPKASEYGGEAVETEDPEPKLSDTFKFSHVFWLLVILCVVVYGCVLPFNNVASSLLLERDYFVAQPSSCALDFSGCQSDANPPNSHCDSSKWYQPPLPRNVVIGGKNYSQVVSDDVDCTSSDWSDGCTSEYCNRLEDGEAKAAVIMSIPYIISAVLSPILGIFIDKFGMRAIIATCAPVILVVVHSLLAVTDVDPIGPLVGQGLAYTGFAAVLWPAIPLVVEERLTGLAFGVVTSMLNLGCAVFPLVVAKIYDDSDSTYIPNVEFLFVGLGAIGTAVGIYLNIYDVYHDSVLNRGEDPDRKMSGRTEESEKVWDKSSSYRESAHVPIAHLKASDDQAARSVSSDNSSIILFSGDNVIHEPIHHTGDADGSSGNDDGMWKTNYVPRRAVSTANPLNRSLFVSPYRDSANHSASLHSRESLIQSNSAHNRESIDSAAQGPVRRHSTSNRQRGSSFTAYQEIHRGGGF